MESIDNLLSEMLQKFPELPPETVKAHVKLFPRNRTALLAELSRVSSTLGAVGGGKSSGENSSEMYSDFEVSGAENNHCSSLQMPEAPPSLIITPPQSPEKTNTPRLCIAGNRKDYESFLLQNQKDRLRALEEATVKNQERLMKLRDEVARKERLLYENSVKLCEETPNLTIDSLVELAQANRQLCVQTQCLVTEIDLQTDGKAFLGFYDNIYPGPDNPMVTIQTPSRRRQKEKSKEPQRWNCNHCTFANYPAMINCEICNNPRSSTPSISSN